MVRTLLFLCWFSTIIKYLVEFGVYTLVELVIEDFLLIIHNHLSLEDD